MAQPHRARAQHRGDARYQDNSRATVEAKAQYVYDVSGEAQRSLFKQFFRSRNYGELLGKIGQIRGKAIHIRTLARIDTCERQILKEAQYLDKLIHEFESLVEIARVRSERGLDRPLRGCTLHMDAKTRGMLDAVHCMTDVLEQPVIRQRSNYRPREQYGVMPSRNQDTTNFYRYPTNPRQSRQPNYRQPNYDFGRGGRNTGFQIEIGGISFDNSGYTIRYNR